MKTEEIKLSLLQNLQTYQSKVIDLNEVLRLIKYDDYLKQKTEWYRDRAAIVSRSYANEEVKQKEVPVFSVSVLFNGMGKQMSHVVRFTGLALAANRANLAQKTHQALTTLQPKRLGR